MLGLLLLLALPSSSAWWKGNLHTHSLLSDGDDTPENIAAWYKGRGYHFLAFSEHNKLVARLPELRARFEEPGRFLLVDSEEISDRFGKTPIHVNATNVRDHIPPMGGGSVREVLQNNIDAVLAQRRRRGLPMFPHINHPNFGWAMTHEDIASTRGERFFEVYNGHFLVHNEGDHEHRSTEELWDLALAERAKRRPFEPLYALAVDDAHNYHEHRPGKANPGRGWVVVRAPSLDALSLIAAMEKGDFYASSGVVLEDVTRSSGTLSLRVAGEPCLIEFISGGKVAASVTGTAASYALQPGQDWVRARVTSARLKRNPYRPGEYETAWTQPVFSARLSAGAKD